MAISIIQQRSCKGWIKIRVKSHGEMGTNRSKTVVPYIQTSLASDRMERVLDGICAQAMMILKIQTSAVSFILSMDQHGMFVRKFSFNISSPEHQRFYKNWFLKKFLRIICTMIMCIKFIHDWGDFRKSRLLNFK